MYKNTCSQLFQKRKSRSKVILCSDVVRPGGFEPLTFGVGVQRSIQLSYDRILDYFTIQNVKSQVLGRTFLPLFPP